MNEWGVAQELHGSASGRAPTTGSRDKTTLAVQERGEDKKEEKTTGKANPK